MDTKQETILQAVLLADPFEHQSRYGPLIRGGNQDGEGCTSATPWCLLSFLNAPLIAWTLESLSASNVQVVHIIIREGAKELQEWLDLSTFTAPTAAMSIRIRQTQAHSEGDVMHQVDGLALTGDWLLVRAGYIGNIDLEKAVQDFTAKRKKEPGLLMESLVTQSNPSSPHVRSSTHILSKDNHLMHYYHQPRQPPQRRTAFSLEHLTAAKDLSIRLDIETVGVDICNMEVPALFVENFDYANMRPDFISGVLTSDILGKTILCSVVGENPELVASSSRGRPWGTHVSDVASYAAASKSVIARWSYPIVLDQCIPGSEECYEQRRGRLYLGRKLTLARSCSTGPASVIGRRSIIGERSDVVNSTLGESCRIGSDVRIQNSYIFDGVTIDDDCLISDSILAEGVHIQAGSRLSGGCLIGPGVSIGEEASLHAKRISTEQWGSSAQDVNNASNAERTEGSYLGNSAQGYIWPSEEQVHLEEQDSDDEDALDVRNIRSSSFPANQDIHIIAPADGYNSDTTASTISRSSSSDDLRSEYGSDAGSDASDPPAIAGIGALNEDEGTVIAAFQKECTSSLDRSFAEGHTVDNAAIELKTLRMASNVPLKDVMGVVVPYLCDRTKVPADAQAKAVGQAVNKLVERWGGLVNSLTGGTEQGQVEALFFLQEHCASSSEINARLFPAMLQAFYQEDVVSEEAVRAWVTNPAAKTTGGPAGAKLWQTGATFMRALMEAEDDSDEDESD